MVRNGELHEGGAEYEAQVTEFLKKAEKLLHRSIGKIPFICSAPIT
jgi:hypothetical protein